MDGEAARVYAEDEDFGELEGLEDDQPEDVQGIEMENNVNAPGVPLGGINNQADNWHIPDLVQIPLTSDPSTSRLRISSSRLIETSGPCPSRPLDPPDVSLLAAASCSNHPNPLYEHQLDHSPPSSIISNTSGTSSTSYGGGGTSISGINLSSSTSSSPPEIHSPLISLKAPIVNSTRPAANFINQKIIEQNLEIQTLKVKLMQKEQEVLELRRPSAVSSISQKKGKNEFGQNVLEQLNRIESELSGRFKRLEMRLAKIEGTLDQHQYSSVDKPNKKMNGLTVDHVPFSSHQLLQQISQQQRMERKDFLNLIQSIVASAALALETPNGKHHNNGNNSNHEPLSFL